MQSCKDDDLILTGQPSWLGNSIYEWLQEEGNYKYTLRLIDDLGETEVLSHTGSRTLFVAADSAYDKWFNSNNQWGVTSYENLSLPQKRLLLKNSMIDNAYLLELMSNQKAVSDAALPEWGRTMRRTTATSYFDSVYVMKPEEMPENDYWEPIRARGKNIRILKDACAAPMIHFLPAYLKNHQITAEDLNLLTNRRATSIEEAWVNGVKVVNSGDASRKKYDYDITCKNGYIQKVERVIEASPNMALIIHNDPQMSTWSHLLDRFSAPYSYLALTKSYEKALQEEYGKDFLFKDSLFVLRYNSKSYYDWSKGKKVIVEKSDKYLDPYGKAVDQNELLKFDPGWNQYIDNNDMNELHNDAGMMIVPTDDAVKAWWEGEGSELKDEYGDLDNVPTSDAELQQQMADNPNMSLANGGDATTDASSAPVDFTNTTDPIDNAATSDSSAPKGEETAGFVDGDLTNETPSAESNEPPAVAANVVTAPGAKKSNKPLFMALGGVGIFAIIIIAIIIIMSL